jgi:hypothetical protein
MKPRLIVLVANLALLAAALGKALPSWGFPDGH